MHCSWLFGGAVKRVRAGRYHEADPILREVLTRLSSPTLDPNFAPVASLVFTANILAAQIALELGDRERARETLRGGLAAWGSAPIGTNKGPTDTIHWARTTLETLDS